MKKKLLIIFLLIFCKTQLQASTQWIKTIENAVQKHPKTQSQEFYLSYIKQHSTYDPYYYNPSVEIGVGRQTFGSSFGHQFDFSYVQGVASSARKKSYKNLQATRIEFEELALKQNRTTLFWDIFETWHAHTLLSIHLEATNKRLQKLNVVRTYLQSRPKLGPQQQADLFLVDMSIRDIRYELLSLEHDLSFKQLDLQTFGFETETLPRLSFTNSHQFFKEHLKTLTPENSFSYQESTLLIEESIKNKTFQSAQKKNDWAWFTRSSFIDTIPNQTTLMLGASFTVPFKNSSDVLARSEDSRCESIDAKRVQITAQINAEIQKGTHEIEHYEETRLLYPDSLVNEFSKEIDRAIEGFKRQEVDLKTIMDMDRSFAELFVRRQAHESEEMTIFSQLLRGFPYEHH